MLLKMSVNNMTMEFAMILTGCLIVFGSAGMASFVIWLRYRDTVTWHENVKRLAELRQQVPVWSNSSIQSLRELRDEE